MAPNAETVNLTVDELAARERTSPNTVRHWLKNGDAPRSFKVGRRRLFALEDVLAWEQAAKTVASGGVPAA